MAKQRVMHGSTIDVVTPEEMADFLAQRDPNIVFGLGGSSTTVEELSEDFPMKGTLRQLTSDKRGSGGDNFVIGAGQLLDLVPIDGARIAGTVTNISTNPVFVYLASRQRVLAQGNPGSMAGGGIVCGYLFANSAWDFKLSNDVWCGPVSVYSALGATLVWGVH